MSYSNDATGSASNNLKELKNMLNKEDGAFAVEKVGQKVQMSVDGQKKGCLKMVPLAGAEEIGMNMTVYFYEKDGDRFAILVDCGVTFEDLPGASVSMPDLSVLEGAGIKIRAVIITHGHEDHIGAIPYLFDHLQVPIYATPFTASLIKKKLDYIRKKNYKIEIVNSGEFREVGPFKIQWINATHSIPDNTMLAIEVGDIRVLHTGDWKDDPTPLVGASTDFASIKKFASKGVHALVSDSTNIHQDNPAVSEVTVANSLKKLVLGCKKGKFVLTCFASNVSRIQGCFEAAREAGRKILILGTSLKKSVEIATDLKYIKNELLVSEEEANTMAPESLMILCTGSQAEENSALWKIANEMRSAGSSLEKNDTLVFSARVIDGRQRAVRKVINQLVEKGVRIIHPWNSESCIHASGHPSKPDVAKLLDTVKPFCVIPVHCEAEHRVSHIAFARSKGYTAFNLRNGVIINISKDGVSKVGAIETKKLVLDGARLVDESSGIFLKRSELNVSGMIAVSVGLKGKALVSMVSNIGVFDDKCDIKNKSTLNKHLKFELDRLLKTFSSSELMKKHSYKYVNSMRLKIIATLKKYIWSSIKKNPIVNVQILS